MVSSSPDFVAGSDAALALLRRAGILVPPRLSLAHLPTRLQRLPRLSQELGIELWVKRDDETGAELSGNKVRKLEYLLAEALRQDADVILTCGGVQSNHCRATALAARRLGMDSVLFLRGTEPSPITGNLLLDRVVGAEVRYITPEQYSRRATLLPAAAEELRASGRRPYVVPEGGSNALGSWGYVQLVAELASQTSPMSPVLPEPARSGRGSEQSSESPEAWDHIVCATGSGGTLAGLVLGRQLLTASVPWLERTRMWGAPVCDDGDYFRRKVREIAAEFTADFTADFAVRPPAEFPADFTATSPLEFPAERGLDGGTRVVSGDDSEEIGILDGYKGPGYAVPYAEELSLIREVGRTEGLLLDPVYTGKAFHALVTEAQKGRFHPGERVLFLHTGGIFSLFAYSDELLG